MQGRVDPALKIERVFICYEDVIRSIKFGVLKYIKQPQVRPNYEDYINFSAFENFTDGQLLAWLSALPSQNLFEMIAKKEFDYKNSYIDTVFEAEGIFLNAYILDIGKSIAALLPQKFVERIYVYYPHDDPRIDENLKMVFPINNNKIHIVTGKFEDAVNSITDNITMYIINDIEMMLTLSRMGRLANSQVMIADYAYNYGIESTDEGDLPVLKIKDIDKFSDENKCYVKVFTPTTAAEYTID